MSRLIPFLFFICCFFKLACLSACNFVEFETLNFAYEDLKSGSAYQYYMFAGAMVPPKKFTDDNFWDDASLVLYA